MPFFLIAVDLFLYIFYEQSMAQLALPSLCWLHITFDVMMLFILYPSSLSLPLMHHPNIAVFMGGMHHVFEHLLPSSKVMLSVQRYFSSHLSMVSRVSALPNTEDQNL